MQFAEKEDLEGYPKDFEKDSIICASEGTHMIFHLKREEMYHEVFCFKGVCTVVTKLLIL